MWKQMMNYSQKMETKKPNGNAKEKLIYLYKMCIPLMYNIRNKKFLQRANLNL